jgi:SAM-dependent methyltransferase
MDSREYEMMYRVEHRHWWYLGMESVTRAVLNRWYVPESKLRILDAGCGTGAAMTTYLAGYGSVTGFDISSIALDFCRRQRIERLARASVDGLPFKPQSFDLVTSFDVLYERGVPDDTVSLREFARVLVRGGRLLLRLPAYDWLRGQHDQVTHTARRYTRGRVASLLRGSGFVVELLSYANTLLFPLVLTKRLAERVWPPRPDRSDLALDAGPFNAILRAALTVEAPLVARLGLPFGLSVIAVGRKP